MNIRLIDTDIHLSFMMAVGVCLNSEKKLNKF